MAVGSWIVPNMCVLVGGRRAAPPQERGLNQDLFVLLLVLLENKS